MPSVVPGRLDVTSKGDLLLERERATEIAASGLLRLCAAGFVAYCSYAICRTRQLQLSEMFDLGHAGDMPTMTARTGEREDAGSATGGID